MIRIYYPTIMDGPVVRWYASVDAHDRGDHELASASRNGCIIHGRLSPERLRKVAGEVASLGEELAATHRRCLNGNETELVAKAWASHRTGGLGQRMRATPIKPDQPPAGKAGTSR